MIIETIVKRLAGDQNSSRYYTVMRFWDSYFANLSIRIHNLYCCTSMNAKQRNH